MEGVWRGKSGGKVGERRRPGDFEASLQCAILAHNPLLVSNVNQQSIPQTPPLAPDQSCESLSHCGTRESPRWQDGLAQATGHVGDWGVFGWLLPACQSRLRPSTQVSR